MRRYVLSLVISMFLTVMMVGQLRPLSCNPSTPQTIGIGQSITFQASGGLERYSWLALGSINPSANYAQFTTSYPAAGSYEVSLSDGLKGILVEVKVVGATTTTLVIPTTTTTTIAVVTTTTSSTTTSSTTTTTSSTTTTTLVANWESIGGNFPDYSNWSLKVGQSMTLATETAQRDRNSWDWRFIPGLDSKFEVRSSDPLTSDITQAGTEIRARGIDPGLTFDYFSYHANNPFGRPNKLPLSWYGKYLTVYDPAEATFLANSKAIVLPETDFIGLGDYTWLKIMVREQLTVWRVVIITTDPLNRTSAQAYNLGWNISPGNLARFAAIETNQQYTIPGRYKVIVTAFGDSGVIGFNRFVYSVGKYSPLGKVGMPHLGFGDVFTDYQGRPAVLGLYGAFPGQIKDRDVRVFVNGEDWSSFLGHYFVPEYRNNFIGLDVSGSHFPAGRYQIIVYDLNTGLVIFGAIDINIDPEDMTQSYCCAGGPSKATSSSTSSSDTADPNFKAWLESNIQKLHTIQGFPPHK